MQDIKDIQKTLSKLPYIESARLNLSNIQSLLSILNDSEKLSAVVQAFFNNEEFTCVITNERLVLFKKKLLGGFKLHEHNLNKISSASYETGMFTGQLKITADEEVVVLKQINKKATPDFYKILNNVLTGKPHYEGVSLRTEEGKKQEHEANQKAKRTYVYTALTTLTCIALMFALGAPRDVANGLGPTLIYTAAAIILCPLTVILVMRKIKKPLGSVSTASFIIGGTLLFIGPSFHIEPKSSEYYIAKFESHRASLYEEMASMVQNKQFQKLRNIVKTIANQTNQEENFELFANAHELINPGNGAESPGRLEELIKIYELMVRFQPDEYRIHLNEYKQKQAQAYKVMLERNQLSLRDQIRAYQAIDAIEPSRANLSKLESAKQQLATAEEAKRKEIADRKAKEAREAKISEMINPWDGSHSSVNWAIKRGMPDPDSFEHIETSYKDNGETLIVVTKFRGKNAFGGYVINTVVAEVTASGHIISMNNLDLD